MAAIGVLCAGVASAMVIGGITYKLGVSILVALTVSQLVMLVLPILVSRSLGLRREVLGLRLPARTPVVAAVLIGCTAWLVNVRIVQLFPFSDHHVTTLNSVVDQPPLWLSLLAVAVLPAVCEEVMFRGAAQRAFATKLFPIAAVLVTSALFGAYHLSLIQLMPAFLLGCLLGALAHRADSVVPAMLAHFLNNAIVILVTRRQPAALADTIAAHPNTALIGCAAASLVGIALLVKSPA